MSEDIDERRARIDQKARELERDFSYDGYQVVRKELFAHMRDPAVVIRSDSVTFNTACIKGLEDTVYIHIMINVEEKKMVIRKCGENDKGALRWCVAKPDKRTSRRMSGKEFTKKLYRDMDWDKDCRYKILGYRITVEEQTLYIFDFSETEIFQDTKTKKGDTKQGTGVEPTKVDQNADDQKGAQPVRRERRKGFLPEEWENSYGLPVEEQDNYRQINLKEGYVPASYDGQREGDSNGE